MELPGYKIDNFEKLKILGTFFVRNTLEIKPTVAKYNLYYIVLT